MLSPKFRECRRLRRDVKPAQAFVGSQTVTWQVGRDALTEGLRVRWDGTLSTTSSGAPTAHDHNSLRAVASIVVAAKVGGNKKDLKPYQHGHVSGALRRSDQYRDDITTAEIASSGDVTFGAALDIDFSTLGCEPESRGTLVRRQQEFCTVQVQFAAATALYYGGTVSASGIAGTVYLERRELEGKADDSGFGSYNEWTGTGNAVVTGDCAPILLPTGYEHRYLCIFTEADATPVRSDAVLTGVKVRVDGQYVIELTARQIREAMQTCGMLVGMIDTGVYLIPWGLVDRGNARWSAGLDLRGKTLCEVILTTAASTGAAVTYQFGYYEPVKV